MSGQAAARADRQAIGYVSAATLLWGSTAAVSELLLGSLNAWQVLFFTSLFAWLGLLVISLAQGRGATYLSYGMRDLATIVLNGVLGVFVYRLLLLLAFVFLPAQEAFVINYAWPAMVVLCAVFVLDERLTAGKALGLALSFLGVVVVVTKGHLTALQLDVRGVLAALGAAVAYGMFSALSKRHDYERYTSMTISYGAATLLSVGPMLASGPLPDISAGTWLGLLWAGLVTGGLAFVFWGLALKHGDTALMSNLVFLTPFLSLVYVNVLLDEPLLGSSIVGLGIIVSGIVVQGRARSRASAAAMALRET